MEVALSSVLKATHGTGDFRLSSGLLVFFFLPFPIMLLAM
jgi:hypothetical protein